MCRDLPVPAALSSSLKWGCLFSISLDASPQPPVRCQARCGSAWAHDGFLPVRKFHLVKIRDYLAFSSGPKRIFSPCMSFFDTDLVPASHFHATAQPENDNICIVLQSRGGKGRPRGQKLHHLEPILGIQRGPPPLVVFHHEKEGGRGGGKEKEARKKPW